MIANLNIKKMFLTVFAALMFSLSFTPLVVGTAAAESRPGLEGSYGDKECQYKKTFFGLPVWYKYLSSYEKQDSQGACGFDLSTPKDTKGQSAACIAAHTAGNTCVDDTSAFVLIGLAIVDILLRIVGFVAVGFVIYGGAKYILSSGEPDAIQKARGTIINALIGVVVALVASGVVAFIGKTLG